MEPVRTGLRQLMSDLLRARPAEEAVLLAWPLVCGREVAARSQAVSFSDGNLVVEVADAAWRKQLQSFAPRYVSGYEGLLGPLVKSVDFKLKQPAAGTQQSAISNQQPAVSTQPSAISNEQSAAGNQQPAISTQPLAISNEQSAAGNQQPAISHRPSPKPIGPVSIPASRHSKKKI